MNLLSFPLQIWFIASDIFITIVAIIIAITN